MIIIVTLKERLIMNLKIDLKKGSKNLTIKVNLIN